MNKLILVLSITLVTAGKPAMAQFTADQVEELTASGIYSAFEPENSSVVNKSIELTEEFRTKDRVSRICAIFDFLYKGWNYSKDPFGMEYFEKAGVSIHTMTGDCDDYSILMVSMLRSIDEDSRVICVSGHAYPEVYIGKDLNSAEVETMLQEINDYYTERGSGRKITRLNYHNDQDGTFWLNLDYQQRRPGGRFYEYSEDAEHLVIYSNGTYRRALLNNE